MKIDGRIIYWNQARHFGVVEHREAWNGGFKVANYFLHQSKIVFMMAEPQIDYFVRFEPGKLTPLPGRLPEAGNAEVYETAEQAEKVELKAGA